MQVPLISLVLERRGIAEWLIGLNGAMTSLAVLVLGPLLPRLIAAIGPSAAMFAGLLIGATATLTMPFVPDLTAWFVLRFVTGAGIALPWLVTETWINLVASDGVRARLMGLYSAALFAGMALGPAVLDAVGTTGTRPFELAVVAMGLAAVPLMTVREFAPKIQPVSAGLSPRAMIRSTPTVALAAIAAGLCEFAMFSLLPVYGVRQGLSSSTALQTLSVFTVGAIVLQIPLGWLADSLSGRHMLALIGSMTALLVPLLALTLGHSPLAWPILFILGGLVLGYDTLGLTLLGRQYEPVRVPVASAAFLMLYEAGAVAGPMLAGGGMALWAPHGYLAVFVLIGLAVVACALWRRDGLS